MKTAPARIKLGRKLIMKEFCRYKRKIKSWTKHKEHGDKVLVRSNAILQSSNLG